MRPLSFDAVPGVRGMLSVVIPWRSLLRLELVGVGFTSKLTGSLPLSLFLVKLVYVLWI